MARRAAGDGGRHSLGPRRRLAATRETVSRAESREQALRVAAAVTRISDGDDHEQAFRSAPAISTVARLLERRPSVRFVFSPPLSSIPRWASAAAARDPRLVVVILRGALDGLSAVAPLGDPDYAELHRELAYMSVGTASIPRFGSTISSASIRR